MTDGIIYFGITILPLNRKQRNRRRRYLDARRQRNRLRRRQYDRARHVDYTVGSYGEGRLVCLERHADYVLFRAEGGMACPLTVTRGGKEARVVVVTSRGGKTWKDCLPLIPGVPGTLFKVMFP